MIGTIEFVLICDPFSRSKRNANEVYLEIGAKNEDFRKHWESVKAFRADQYLWLQLADHTYDNYMMIQQRKKTL